MAPHVTHIKIGFWRRRVLHPLLALLHQGVTPEKIALGVALGITLGITPVLGSTMALCMLAAFFLKLNPAAIQMVNCLMYPVQLLLLIPFIRLGEWLFGSAHSPLTLGRIRQMIETNVWHAVVSLWSATVHALAVWAILASLGLFPIYRLMLIPLRHLANRHSVPKTAAE